MTKSHPVGLQLEHNFPAAADDFQLKQMTSSVFTAIMFEEICLWDSGSVQGAV